MLGIIPVSAHSIFQIPIQGKENQLFLHYIQHSESKKFFLEVSHMALLYSVLNRKRKACEDSNNVCFAVLEFGIPLSCCIKCNHEER